MGCNNKFDKKFFIRTSHECFFCKTQNIVYMTDFTYFVTFHLLFFSCRQTTATTRKAAKRHSHSAGKKDFDLLLEKKISLEILQPDSSCLRRNQWRRWAECLHPRWSTASWTSPKDLRQLLRSTQEIQSMLPSAISQKRDTCDAQLTVQLVYIT